MLVIVGDTGWKDIYYFLQHSCLKLFQNNLKKTHFLPLFHAALSGRIYSMELTLCW